MNELRRVDVAYTEGHWFADIKYVDAPIDCGSLRDLIKTVQETRPKEALLFIVDQTTLDCFEDAAWEFLRAGKNCDGSILISSVQEF